MGPYLNSHIKDYLKSSRKYWKTIQQTIFCDFVFAWYLTFGDFYGRPLNVTSVHVIHVLTITIGITAGYHRLWSHKSYKANKVLQICLIIMASGTYQNSCYVWARDHRVHHRYTETDADPHNAKRGFFFSHMGWLCVTKHPEVKEKGKLIDMSDLETNPIVMFQHKYYYQVVAFFSIILPTYIWHHAVGHSIFLSFLITLYRMMIVLHFTWGVNSFAHLYGTKPYTKNLGPAENLFVVVTTGGEGFHNYHHTFPQDYKASFKNDDFRNYATLFIGVCEWLGLASNLKSVPEKTVVRWSDKFGIKTDNDRHTLMAKVASGIMLMMMIIFL